MTQPDQALLARINADVAAMSSYLGRVHADLYELNRVVALRHAETSYAPPATAWAPPAAQPPATQPTAAPQPFSPPPGRPVVVPPAPPAPPIAAPVKPRSDNWIGKVLAVAGVAVTLVGVVLLLVLAAQAGILRPEIRVGMGALLAAGLVGAALRLNGRPGGRVGAIALAATGIAAAYIDIIAVTTIYEWVPGAVGLVLAAAVAGGGLVLARRWNSEHLALLVLVPLLGLGPIVVGGITLLLVGFMIALSAATLPVQVGKDWLAMHGARMAVSTLPVLIALVAVDPTSNRIGWLAAACGIAALLALLSALVLLPHSGRPVAVALLSAAGTLPVLAASVAVGRITSAVMAAMLAVILLAMVLIGDRLTKDSNGVAAVWSATAAVALLIAITVAFDGDVAGPLLLAVSAVVAVTGRRSVVARWAAAGFGVVGGLYYLVSASPDLLIRATEVPVSAAVSTLVASLLAVASAAAITWSWVGREGSDRDVAGVMWACAAIVGIYAITMFTVTAGVLIGGEEAGFFSGHMAATICWIALAAAVFRYAVTVPRAKRSLPIAAGLTLVVASMAKLFLFDLGTLGGIFRVVVFIVVGLALLGMGAGYARVLSQQDEREQHESRQQTV